MTDSDPTLDQLATDGCGKVVLTAAVQAVRWHRRGLNGQSAVQEAVSDVLTKFLAGYELAKIRQSGLQPLMNRIATNMEIDRLRSAGRGTRRSYPLSSDPTDTLAPSATSQTDESRSAIETALARALAELPPDVRGVIAGRFVSGSTWDELAGDAGLSVGATRRRFDAGLRALAKALRSMAIANPTLRDAIDEVTQLTDSDPDTPPENRR